MNPHGTITRISGPIVQASGLADAMMYEVVEVGPTQLIGEAIRVEGDVATIQVYEDTTGLKPGQAVRRTGAPLSLSLGPGLIGNIYDGIQRPLPAIAAVSGWAIKRGEKVPPLDEDKRWHFAPAAERGAAVEPGAILGTVQEAHSIEHRVMAPPGASGQLMHLVAEGDYTIREVVAVVKDAAGAERKVQMFQRWPVRDARPYGARHAATSPLVTGQRVIDTFFPIARGGAACIPGGFGTGKTMTQHALAKWCNADIIVYIGCGERGNEMTDVLTEFPEIVDPRTGRPLMERTVLIANTSNMPVAAREVSICTGITIAEYYRDMGYHVGVLADSTSRWAEALRELAARLEEMPAEEGFPAYLPSRLASFYERAGAVQTLNGQEGSISIIGAVSPPGGDFSEPVTQHTRRFIRCFWALDTTLANARHYPAIHWLHSYSEYVEDVTEWWQQVEPQWPRLRQQLMELLQREDQLQQIVKLVGPDVLPDSHRLVLLVAEMTKNGFLQQNAFDEVDMYATPAKQAGLLRLLVEFYERACRIIDKGAPLVRIRELSCIQDLVRARSTVPNDKPEQLAAIEERMRSQLDALERSYA
ncbi:MAG: V-type ATP synthase subunit A [Candidatus Brocadiae bacterium]|nr:V-type ATP synthase subunit A [Candidatus Brocadiia bacterium]